MQQLSVLRRNWFQKPLDFKAFLKESFGGHSSSPAFRNQHALDMADDADNAVAEAYGGRVHYCYLTMNVVIIEDDSDIADAHAQEVRKQFLRHGFPARIEDVNAVDAYLGTVPGHGHPNVRKPLVHTQNLADLIPSTAVWAGLETNPYPMYPAQHPGLFLRLHQRAHAVSLPSARRRRWPLPRHRTNRCRQERLLGHYHRAGEIPGPTIRPTATPK